MKKEIKEYTININIGIETKDKKETVKKLAKIMKREKRRKKEEKEEKISIICDECGRYVDSKDIYGSVCIKCYNG